MACYGRKPLLARIVKCAAVVMIVIIVRKQLGAGTKDTESSRALVDGGPELMIADNAESKVVENAGFKIVENTGVKHVEITGFKRAADLKNLCKEVGLSKSKPVGRIRVNYSLNPVAIFCPLCKMASTFWSRVFRMMLYNDEAESPQYRTPFDIPIVLVAQRKPNYDIRTGVVDPNIDVSSAFRFTFVRSPYSLLFSAYGDKIIKPSINFFEIFGKPAVRRLRRGGGDSSGSDVTFAEFVDEVVFQYRQLGKMDCHVAKFGICRPCSMNYTFVGKLETFKQDTSDILSVLGQQTTLDIFKKNVSVLHSQDEVDDVTQRVFSARDGLKRYMKWPDVLRRVWRQLQVRGVINQVRFPLTSEQADSITIDEFRRVIHSARLISKPEETKRLKKMAFIEAFRSVPASLMAEIRGIYEQEFLLFQYDPMPDELYDKDQKIEIHGFLNFSNIDEDLQPRGVFI